MFETFSIAWPSVQQFILAAGILVAAWLASMLVVVTLKRSKMLTSLTETTLDDEILHLLRRPIHLGFQFAGVLLALSYLFPTLSYQGHGLAELIPIALIFWGAYTLDRLIRGIMHWHENEAHLDNPDGKHGTFGFLNTIISMLVYGLAIAFILNQVGVDISALLAGLGIAGLAVALALQGTLSGLFSAVGLAIDRPIRHGDFVQLEDGTSGFVEDISMRSTRIRTFEQNLVIIPNGKLSEMIITNMYLPEQEVTLKVPVGVSYGTDLEKAEQIAIEVANQILKEHNAMGSAEPFVRYGAFGDSAIELKVYLRVNKFLTQFVVKHEFIKALKFAYDKEKIEIPFPQMDIHVHK